MRNLFLIFLAAFSCSCFALRLNPEQLKFYYIPYEGENVTTPCKHEIENRAAQDWKVRCGDKNYTVHLWLTEWARSTEPKLTLELLYWVSDKTQGSELTANSGTTLWLNMKQESSVQTLTVKQGVENDTAGLYLDIKI